jgi:hypothetical protein
MIHYTSTLIKLILPKINTYSYKSHCVNSLKYYREYIIYLILSALMKLNIY